MTTRAAITVRRPHEEVARAWAEDGRRDATVSFREAPGDHGTEIHLELPPPGPLGRLRHRARLAAAKDDLRRFKQRLETGEIARSDGSPTKQHPLRKLRQRPANPGGQR